MQIMALIVILFLVISVLGFAGALLFGSSGATALVVLGLSIGFIGISVLIGR